MPALASGKNLTMPIISSHIRVRHPDHFEVGLYSVVDDFCYFSTRVIVGKCSHIASGCSVAGGLAHQFVMGDFSSLSSGVKIWCVSDDFVNDLICIVPNPLLKIKENSSGGDVLMGQCTGVGANSVVMPCNEIPEGTSIGALSFVPPGYSFKPWSVYAGIPIRYIGRRNRDSVLRQRDKLAEALNLS